MVRYTRSLQFTKTRNYFLLLSAVFAFTAVFVFHSVYSTESQNALLVTRLDFLDIQLHNHSKSLEQLEHQTQSLSQAFENSEHIEEGQKAELKKLQDATSNAPDIGSKLNREVEVVHRKLLGDEFPIYIYKDEDIVSRFIRRQGGFENSEILLIADHFRKYSKQHNIPLKDLTFIDIGGNIGWFSFNLAALGVQVHTFEPMQENLDIIQKTLQLPENIKSGLSDRITLHPYGLGTRAGICFMYSQDSNFGNGHLKCVDKESDLTLPRGYSIRGRTSIRRLDDVLDIENLNVVVAKMDTEGNEYNVVAGGENVLLRSVKSLIVTELNPTFIRDKGGDPQKFLERFYDSNFRLKGTDQEYLDKTDTMHMEPPNKVQMGLEFLKITSA